jgi:hypothetical protein
LKAMAGARPQDGTSDEIQTAIGQKEMVKVPMAGKRTVAAGVAMVLATASVLSAQSDRYRDFQLGTSVASVMAQSGAAPTDAKVIHQRPALIQEVRWTPA